VATDAPARSVYVRPAAARPEGVTRLDARQEAADGTTTRNRRIAGRSWQPLAWPIPRPQPDPGTNTMVLGVPPLPSQRKPASTLRGLQS
jgi:hypothetical protein